MESLKRQLHNLSRDLRNLERLISSEAFREAYNDASPSEKAALECLIEGAMSQDCHFRDTCVSTLKGEIRRLNLSDWTIRDLRDKAQELGVQGWSRLNKEDLLSAIYKKELSDVQGNNGQSHKPQGDSPKGRTEANSDRLQEVAD